ncbi:hypothetical protein BHS62_12060 [Salmonella enterica]|nr:hypothetical protein [Salmonella enterica]EAX6579305.1 hypothetical protein [Salmonella enterica]
MIVFKGKTADDLNEEDVIEIANINPDHLPLNIRSHMEAIIFTAKEAIELNPSAREDGIDRVKRIMKMEGCYDGPGVVNLPHIKAR